VLNEELLWGIARCLSLLGDHAVGNAGAFGDVLVEARVVGQGMRLAYLQQIGPVSFPQEIAGVRTLGLAASRHTLTLEALAGDAQDLLAATRLVASDIFNAFGSPEVRHIAPDGTLRIRYFGSAMADVKRYAEADGIRITEEAVPGE
jgi:hypothetical protein